MSFRYLLSAHIKLGQIGQMHSQIGGQIGQTVCAHTSEVRIVARTQFDISY